MQVVLHADETLAQTYFSLTCLTAPVSGVIIGGSITTYFGGFENENAQRVCIFNSFMASMFAMPIPFLNSFLPVVILLWLLLFLDQQW